MEETKNLEEKNLRELMKLKKTAKLYLMNGYQLHGKILAFDERVIIIREDRTGEIQMVFRHAISTLVL